jgi:hypothetical protein
MSAFPLSLFADVHEKKRTSARVVEKNFQPSNKLNFDIVVCIRHKNTTNVQNTSKP